MLKKYQALLIVVIISSLALFIALPEQISFKFINLDKNIKLDKPSFNFLGKNIDTNVELKKGLDIQGGMQLVLQAVMANISQEDRLDALESAREVISRRVDYFGISEANIHTAVTDDNYRIIVELPGISDKESALNLLGKTAELDFRLESTPSAEATVSAIAFIESFQKTDLTGKNLKKSTVQFDQQTRKPVIALEFDDEGSNKFAEITKNNIGKSLAIFIDGFPITMPTINDPILNGRAIISGSFTLEEAKALSIQLNSGALPVTIEVLEQKNIQASLGEESVNKSLQAGVIGLVLIMLFMILSYGFSGIISSLALILYGIYTITIYKLFNVTLTLPGIAGLLLSIGMAVDANILIFERIKEEKRLGYDNETALERGFDKTQQSIKDANILTVITALVLINPLNFTFLNTSGMVRGFGMTLLIGVIISVITGITITKILFKAFYNLFRKKK